MKSLSYFMREEKEEIISVPAPEGFVDEDGNALMLEVRVLTNARIQEIFANYRKRSIATNSKGVPYLSANNNEVIFKTERDNPRAVRHIIAEALVYPDLRDKELMGFYKCNDITEMPSKVFPRTDEFNHVNRMVMKVLGVGDDAAPDDELMDEAKN